MCRMASFINREDPKSLRVEVALGDLESHSKTYELHPDKTEKGGWYEGHYTPAGLVECRTPDGNSYRASQELQSRYPTFDAFIWGMFKAGMLPYSRHKDVVAVLKAHGVRT